MCVCVCVFVTDMRECKAAAFLAILTRLSTSDAQGV